MSDTTARHSPITPGASPPAARWISASATHVGTVRSVNEDALFEGKELGLWAVADGVGGGSAGDRASGMVVEALGKIRKPATASAFLSDVCGEVKAVHEVLRREGPEATRGVIASTIVALLFFERHYACAWAGDSRLYLLRDGNLQQISRDHSRVQDLVDQGILTAEEARTDSRGNVITRAVGGNEQFEIEVVHGPYLPDDVFLLCTDGLTKSVEDDEIALLLRLPVPEAVDALVNASLLHGTRDNVTVVVVQALA